MKFTKEIDREIIEKLEALKELKASSALEKKIALMAKNLPEDGIAPNFLFPHVVVASTILLLIAGAGAYAKGSTAPDILVQSIKQGASLAQRAFGLTNNKPEKEDKDNEEEKHQISENEADPGSSIPETENADNEDKTLNKKLPGELPDKDHPKKKEANVDESVNQIISKPKEILENLQDSLPQPASEVVRGVNERLEEINPPSPQKNEKPLPLNPELPNQSGKDKQEKPVDIRVKLPLSL